MHGKCNCIERIGCDRTGCGRGCTDRYCKYSGLEDEKSGDYDVWNGSCVINALDFMHEHVFLHDQLFDVLSGNFSDCNL